MAIPQIVNSLIPVIVLSYPFVRFHLDYYHYLPEPSSAHLNEQHISNSQLHQERR